MPRGPLSPSHRFVVVWRSELREIACAAEIRRGWVERVPDPRALVAGKGPAQRVGFHQLDELPDVIAQLIDDAEGPRRRPRS